MPADLRPVAASRTEPRYAPEPEQPKRRFGLFGSRKDKVPEMRQEPARSATMPRATTQAMGRNEPQRATAPEADDLFPESRKDDQFEIPAFLRRQQN
jgi:hypothetical protein